MTSTSPRYSVSAISDAGDQRAEDRRQADARGGEAGEDDDQQADREEQLRGSWSARPARTAAASSEAADASSIAAITSDPSAARPSRPPDVGCAAPIAPSAKMHRDQREILEQQHREGGAADRRSSSRHRQHERGRRQSQREAERDRARAGWPISMQSAADQDRASRAARPRRPRTPAGASPTAAGSRAPARSRTAAG